MKTIISHNMETSNKRAYTKPNIDIVKIDNEISVFMNSENPYENPDEGGTSLNPLPFINFSVLK